MRLIRWTAKIVLVIFILSDALFVWRLWRHGPLISIRGGEEIRPGEVSFKITKFPATAHDYIELAIMIASQVAIAGFLWWSRRRFASNE